MLPSSAELDLRGCEVVLEAYQMGTRLPSSRLTIFGTGKIGVQPDELIGN